MYRNVEEWQLTPSMYEQNFKLQISLNYIVIQENMISNCFMFIFKALKSTDSL